WPFVWYRGTAVALHLGHRTSVDFDFFRSAPLDKKQIETSFPFMLDADHSGGREHACHSGSDAVRSRKGVVFRKDGDRKDQRAASNERLGASRRVARGFARHETQEHFGPRRGQGLPGYFRDAVGRHLLGDGIRRVRQNVRPGPYASSESDGLLQGRRFAFASYGRSECPSRGERSRFRDSGSSADVRFACGCARRLQTLIALPSPASTSDFGGRTMQRGGGGDLGWEAPRTRGGPPPPLRGEGWGEGGLPALRPPGAAVGPAP